MNASFLTRNEIIAYERMEVSCKYRINLCREWCSIYRFSDESLKVLMIHKLWVMENFHLSAFRSEDLMKWILCAFCRHLCTDSVLQRDGSLALSFALCFPSIFLTFFLFFFLSSVTWTWKALPIRKVLICLTVRLVKWHWDYHFTTLQFTKFWAKTFNVIWHMRLHF